MITDDAKLIKALSYAEHIAELIEHKARLEDDIAWARGGLSNTVNALGTRVDASPSADAIPNAVIRVQELIREYCVYLSEYVDEIHRFNVSLTQIEATQARVLSLRYLHGLEYKQIADKLCYHEKHIYKIRAAGLIALYDVMPDYWRTRAIPDAQDATSRYLHEC